MFTAVVYVLTSGCAWRHLPPAFGTSSATAHRRFTVWSRVAATYPEEDGPGVVGGAELFRQWLELGVDGAVLVAEELTDPVLEQPPGQPALQEQVQSIDRVGGRLLVTRSVFPVESTC